MAQQEHINLQAARDGMRTSIGLIAQGMKEQGAQQKIEKRSQLSAFIVRDFMPTLKSVRLTPEGAQQLQQRGQDLGMDPAESIELYNDIVEGAQMQDIDPMKILQLQKAELDIQGKAIDIAKKLQPGQTPQEKAIAEHAKDFTVPALKALQTLSVQLGPHRGDPEEIIDQLGDIYPDSGIEKGFFERNQVTSLREAAKLVAARLKTTDEFLQFKVDDLTDAVLGLLRRPGDVAVVDEKFKELSTARGGFDQFQAGSLASL